VAISRYVKQLPHSDLASFAEIAIEPFAQLSAVFIRKIALNRAKPLPKPLPCSKIARILDNTLIPS
jgi:hypothetical protein